MKDVFEFYDCLAKDRPHLSDFVEREHWDFIFFSGKDDIPLITVRPLTSYGNLMLEESYHDLESFVMQHCGSLSYDRHLLSNNQR